MAGTASNRIMKTQNKDKNENKQNDALEENGLITLKE